MKLINPSEKEKFIAEFEKEYPKLIKTLTPQEYIKMS